MQAYDLIVIGSGPGGQRAAIQAAKSGKRVAIIEKQGGVGGVCTNTGTIPSKTMREKQCCTFPDFTIRVFTAPAITEKKA